MRIHFAEWAWLWAMFDYHVVFDPGPIADAAPSTGRPAPSAFACAAGSTFSSTRGSRSASKGFYERFSLTFNPTAATAPAKIANSGTDQYFGGVIVVGYVL